MKKHIDKITALPVPNEIHCQLGARPGNDNGYFEQMTKSVFCSGLKWEVIENKWPGFHRAFAGFVIDKVARFGEPDIDRLMGDRSIVCNYRKVLATIDNARELQSVQKDYGSFKKYLKALNQSGEQALCKTLSKRFNYLGGATVLFFLRAVGEKMPEMMQRREQERMRKSILGIDSVAGFSLTGLCAAEPAPRKKTLDMKISL